MTGLFFSWAEGINVKTEEGNAEMHLEIITGGSRKNPAVNINLSPPVGDVDDRKKKR